MLRVGLTGGIGAGKSAVASRLAAAGAVIIDSDRLSREVVAPGTDGLAEIAEIFGPGVLAADGTLDRPALGARVFGDEDARRRLEKVIHPRVRARAVEMTAEAPRDAIVVNDVPLLAETGMASSFHLVLVVAAERDRRVRRLIETRGMAVAEAEARIAAQADDETRARVADVLIDNNDTLDALHATVDALVSGRLRPFEAHLRLRSVARPPAGLSIAEPDPTWPGQADRLLSRLRYALRDQAAHAHLAHIGSTAVPGLPAKDIIDLMLGVRTLDEADALATTLGDAGFPRRPGEWSDNARDLPGETWPKRVHGSADPGRPVNLHVRVIGSPGWRFALLMRDHLRAVAPARDAYAEAKAEWIKEHQDRLTYGQAKEPWFDSEAGAADAWALSTGWHPET